MKPAKTQSRLTKRQEIADDMKKRFSPKLKQTLPTLNLIARLPVSWRKKLLKELSNEQNIFDSLHEIAHNTIKKNYPINKRYKETVRQTEPLLKKICCPKTRANPKLKQQVVEQSGEGLPALLIPIIAAIASANLF